MRSSSCFAFLQHGVGEIWYNVPVFVECVMHLYGKRNETTWRSPYIKMPGKLLRNLRCRDAAEMYFEVLKKRVSEFKNSEEGRHVMCKAVEGLVEKGKRETMLATAKRMLKDGVLALKDIARYSGLSLAQVKRLQASMA